MKREGKYYECIGDVIINIPIHLKVKVSCSILADNQEDATNKLEEIVNKNGFLIDNIKVGNPLLDFTPTNTVSINSYESIKKSILKYLMGQEISEIKKGIRFCSCSRNSEKIPYGYSIPEEYYNKYVKKYKSDVIGGLNVNYLCFNHEHEDTYVHFAPMNVLKNIISCGYLSWNTSDEENSLGKGIYTFPLKSGLFYYQELNVEWGFLVFEATAKHHHIVQTDDVAYGIGEADFLMEKVEIKNPRIISTYEEMEELSRSVFDWKYACEHYFGIETDETATYEDICDVIARYN